MKNVVLLFPIKQQFNKIKPTNSMKIISLYLDRMARSPFQSNNYQITIK